MGDTPNDTQVAGARSVDVEVGVSMFAEVVAKPSPSEWMRGGDGLLLRSTAEPMEEVNDRSRLLPTRNDFFLRVCQGLSPRDRFVIWEDIAALLEETHIACPLFECTDLLLWFLRRLEEHYVVLNMPLASFVTRCCSMTNVPAHPLRLDDGIDHATTLQQATSATAVAAPALGHFASPSAGYDAVAAATKKSSFSVTTIDDVNMTSAVDRTIPMLETVQGVDAHELFILCDVLDLYVAKFVGSRDCINAYHLTAVRTFLQFVVENHLTTAATSAEYSAWVQRYLALPCGRSRLATEMRVLLDINGQSRRSHQKCTRAAVAPAVAPPATPLTSTTNPFPGAFSPALANSTNGAGTALVEQPPDSTTFGGGNSDDKPMSVSSSHLHFTTSASAATPPQQSAAPQHSSPLTTPATATHQTTSIDDTPSADNVARWLLLLSTVAAGKPGNPRGSQNLN